LRAGLGHHNWRTGSFNPHQGRGGEERGWNKQNGEQCSAPASCKCLAETRFVEQPFNALSQMTGACHGNSCKGWAREGREFKQDLGVGGAAGGFFKPRAIADGFTQFRQSGF
jgi:hypothetical protein